MDIVCRLEKEGLPGLVFEGGGLMSEIRPHRDIRGREFVGCVHANYLLDNWPLKADVLLDAEHPGSTPAGLPLMRRLAGRPGISQGPGAVGELVARRIPGAWILVWEGEGEDQRLRVPEHLRVKVDP